MDSKLKIAATGLTGLVGSRIAEVLKDDFEFISLDYPDFDITNADTVRSKLDSLDYDIFLHLAGYTQVDKAEEEREVCYNLNVTGTKNVYNAVLEKDKPFIFFSTPFVFDGKNPPYNENSQPNPLGYYAQTKYEAEQFLKDRAMVVRIETPYRAQYDVKKDFFRTIYGLLKEGKQITMINDSKITPTFIDDIAGALVELVHNYVPTTYHIVGSDSPTPYEAGQTICKVFGLDASLISPISFEEYSKGKAPRPQWLEVTSKKNHFYKMTSFEEGLKRIKSQSTL